MRRELGEAAGTFFLMLVGGAALLRPGPVDAALAFGGVVCVLVYALGPVSGAHFNPAITLGFAAVGRFPWRSVPGYVAAQLAGAITAVLLLAGLFGDTGPLVAHLDAPVASGLAAEVAATALLAFVIAGVALDERVPRAATGVAIGLAVALGSLLAGPVSGGALNPARALAPAVAAGAWSDLWLHIVGPLVGGVAGMAASQALRDRPAPPVQA